jgi:hypothetical protein
MQSNLNARRLIRCLLLVSCGMEGKDLYVSPSGTPFGPGTILQPYNLATALSGQVGQPGDTFWLMGGEYVIGHINTTIQGAAGRPITFQQLPGEWARVNGSLTFFDSMGYVVLRNFELFNSDTNRVSAETNVGFNVTDINIISGISSYAPNLSFINLIVHDQTREGIYISQSSPNNLIYGCVVYNNGWRSPDNAEGHGVYVQGWNGNRVISDSLAFNNSGIGFQIYDNASNNYLADITLDGNTAFNAGAIQNVRYYRDWVVGVDAPSISANRIVFENNLGYFLPSGEEDQVQIGRQGVNGKVTILNNYLPPGLQFNNWTMAEVTGNTFSATSSNNAVVTLDQTLEHLAAAWNHNAYYADPATSGGFRRNWNALSFSSWRSTTGYDSSSTCSLSKVGGAKIFVRPNQYEPGRASIIVYNWNNLSNVSVDAGSVLTPGAVYEVRNAEDFFAPPVLRGVYDGKPLELPMTGLTVAVPNGPMNTPAPTGPTFNVFVLLPGTVQLQASVSNGLAEISWPTNSSKFVLQFTSNLTPGAKWTDMTDKPSITGSNNVLVIPVSQSAEYYRLRTGQ